MAFHTIYQNGTSEIIEKKSRFIGYVKQVLTEEEAIAYIDFLKKQYYDARHHCSAYILGDKGQLMRYNDDGEPSGTAGKPMLDVLVGNKLTYTVVVVIRYFGGTLLGTGGLVRAYTLAAKQAVENASIITKNYYSILLLQIDYGLLGKLQYILAEENIITIDTIYEDNVTVKVGVLEERAEKLEKLLIDKLNGKIIIKKEECILAGIVDNEFVL